MVSIDQEISDFAAAILLRYFRPGEPIHVENPSLDLARDIELLRAHWAISAPVRNFLRYLLDHRHEAQALLQFQRRVDDAVARGQIDARASVIARRITGHPSLTISKEPVRSYNTGPNQVVAWVVQAAATYAERLHARQPKTSAYIRLIEEVMKEILAVKRLDVLREPLKHISVGRRPSPNDLRDAARSRRLIYRKAISAYATLTKIEGGDNGEIYKVLRKTLLGPLEEWRRFELAVAAGIGEALAFELRVPLRLSVLGAGSCQPVLQCGPFSLYWQSGGGLYKAPPPEPSEKHLETILSAYDLPTSADRPDLVLVDYKENRVISIVEVKYLTSDAANIRFREAAEQIIRYGRGYCSPEDLPVLIRRSLIALSRGAPPLRDKTASAPMAVDFREIKGGKLREWVRERLIPGY